MNLKESDKKELDEPSLLTFEVILPLMTTIMLASTCIIPFHANPFAHCAFNRPIVVDCASSAIIR